jgi:ABC-2 type transport system permease protein
MGWGIVHGPLFAVAVIVAALVAYLGLSGRAILGTFLVAALIGIATGQALFGWIALVLGVGLGCMFTVIGVRIGGGIFDRRAPELLAGLRKQA